MLLEHSTFWIITSSSWYCSVSFQISNLFSHEESWLLHIKCLSFSLICSWTWREYFVCHSFSFLRTKSPFGTVTTTNCILSYTIGGWTWTEPFINRWKFCSHTPLWFLLSVSCLCFVCTWTDILHHNVFLLFKGHLKPICFTNAPRS